MSGFVIDSCRGIHGSGGAMFPAVAANSGEQAEYLHAEFGGIGANLAGGFSSLKQCTTGAREISVIEALRASQS